MDESILSAPNLANDTQGMIDILLKRKIKDKDIKVEDLLDGDRTAILIFLRATGLGEKYTQMVWDDGADDFVPGEIDLTTLKQIKLEIRPDENGEFDYELPVSNKKIKFKFLTGKDEKNVSEMDKVLMERSTEKISNKLFLRLEKSITEIDGNRDKITLSNILKHLTIKDARSLRKYIVDNEPGLDFNTTARTPGGASVACFLRFNQSFFWPEL